MINSTFIKWLSLPALLAGILFASFNGYSQVPAKTHPPNIVLIFMDDMGYGDIGANGATGFATPNLDKLASQGMRFTNFYAAQAVCSASRAGLLTGCYPNRIGITGALMPWSRIGLNPEETTIPEMLKPLGYSTAIFGKWHLGCKEGFMPLQHGFDEFFGLLHSNDMWHIGFDGKPITDSADYRINYPPLILMEGNKPLRELKSLQDLDLLTTCYTEHALDFIHRNKDKPFFLYLAHSMPHVPLAVSDKFRGKSQQGLYGDVIEEIDWSVGQVMKALEEEGLANNTIVIFTSDNGPWLCFGNHAGSAGGLREGKGTSYEGGQREPCVMRWPGIIPAGAICSNLATTLDILPTLAHSTGAKLPDKPIDGLDISSLWQGVTDADPRKVFYYYYGRNSLEAVRMGQWKMVFPHTFESYEDSPAGQNGFPGKKPIRTAELALYDLRNDPGERYNVLVQNPKIADSIRKVADLAREDMGDALTGMPGKNNREPGHVKVDYATFSQKINHLAVGRPVLRQYADASRNHLDSVSVLTDGFRLTKINEDNELRYWQGFEGEDFDVVIDLGKFVKADSVKINFLHESKSWIFRPDQVSILVSEDGKYYQKEWLKRSQLSSDQRKAGMEQFVFRIGEQIRYIRIVATNIKTCPDWHVGAGKKAWVFADEIVIW